MTIILGIDPGLQHTGWGVIAARGNGLSFVACGTIHTQPKQAMTDRLRTLHDGLQQVIRTHAPHEAALEETFVNMNNASSLKLAQARGAIMLSVSLEGLHLYEYSTNLIKKSVVGSGHADKTQVAMMVRTLLPSSNAQGADASDALAVAICHAHLRTQNALLAKVSS
jgi:crossover junction endodeoxyribonuclease RuvC